MMTNKKEIKPKDVFTDLFIENLAYSVVKRVLTSATTLLIVGLILFNIIFTLSVGPSMHPTIPDNSIVVVHHTKKNFKRGDIVIFNSLEESSIYTKRIIGLPGDVVDIKNNKVYVNSVALNEEYAKGITFGQGLNYSKNYKIEKNAYYVLGDNRENSMDSRDFGSIKKDKIIGKKILVIPIGEIIKDYNLGVIHLAIGVIILILIICFFIIKKKTMSLDNIDRPL